MKTIKSINAPSNLLFFDTETKGTISPKKKSIVRHSLWFGIAQSFRYVKGKRTREKNRVFTDIETFWDFVESRLDPQRPLYVFAHNLGFDLTITDFWLGLERRKMTVNFPVLEDPPTFIDVTWNDSKVIFVDTLNYWRTSLKQLGESFQMPKLEMPSRDMSYDKWLQYCRRDTEILATSVTSLIDYLLDNNLGSFALSAPSIAMGVYKHRFMSHAIFVHNNRHALSIERDSYYGGLVNCYYIGKTPKGLVYHLDVNSLYPSVMVDNFPTKLTHYERYPTLSKVIKHMRYGGAAALVQIDSQKNTYPYRYEGKLLEVKGSFETYLCGPELENVIVNGDCKNLPIVAYYEMAPIFKEFVEYFWTERLKYKDNNDTVKQTFTKLLMNSLYGKFGQKGYEWQDVNRDNIKQLYIKHGIPLPRCYDNDNPAPTILWRQNKWFPVDLREPITVRAMGGKVQMRVIVGEHTESSPIIAAYVTAYARHYLHQLMKAAGPKQVYYCDTDSLFVTKEGYLNLKKADYLDDRELGKLKLEGVSNHVVFYGPKDYIFEDKVVLKGIRPDALPLGNGEFMQNQFEGLRSVLKRKPDPYIEIAWITKKNSRIYTKGIVSETGWVNPFTLPDDLYGEVN